MVTQARTALRGVAEMGKTLDLEGSQASRFFAITDDGGHDVHHDMDEVLVCRPATVLSYCNLLKESTPSRI